MTKTWQPNEKQQNFIEELKKYPDGVTLLDLKVAGKEFATGTINTLVSKGLVKTRDGKIQCSIVYKGVEVGIQTKPAKIYSIAE